METRNHAPASLKTRLARALHPIERAVDRIKYRAAKNPVIEPYLGYATADRLVLRGRVLSAVHRDSARHDQSRWINLKQMLLLFATDEVTGITVTAGGVDGVTDEEGYFTLLLPRPDVAGWHSVEAHLPDHPKTQVTLQALVPDPGAAFGVISDIDDTVLETGAFSLARNLWTSLTGNALTRHVFPDAVALIDRLHDGRNPVYYVSSSPWNLFRFLIAIFDRHRLLRGPMFLRDLGLSETQFITGTHGGHKGSSIDAILGANPKLSFVLIGDTGQEDAHVYLDAHRRHPGRIRTVILREPGPGPDHASKTAIAQMSAENLRVMTGPDFSKVNLKAV